MEAPNGKGMTTRIDKLDLTNFRCFRELSLSFHPELTLLVAPNGGGKTAILDALKIALQGILDILWSEPASRNVLSPPDIKLGSTPEGAMVAASDVSLRVSGLLDGRTVAWKVGYTASQFFSELWSVAPEALRLVEHLRDYADRKRSDPPSLPVFAYYGTGRLWASHEPKKRKKKFDPRADVLLTAGYSGCLTSASRYDRFTRWFERAIREAQNELTSGTPSPHRPQQLLAAVRQAVDAVLRPSGWHTLDWDFLTSQIIATHLDRGRLPVDSLSDGIRNLLGLVADLAQRAVQLNPHLGSNAAKLSSGVVLIDEVDMHLHPAWQQTILTSLRAAFPHIQWIVTTHSHIVVTTVPSECVRMLREDGTVTQPELETQGYDSPFALGLVFGVGSMPPIEIATQLSNYRALVEQGQGDTGAAQSLQGILEKHFGAQHPAMQAVENMKRLQSLKAQIAAKRGGR